MHAFVRIIVAAIAGTAALGTAGAPAGPWLSDIVADHIFPRGARTPVAAQAQAPVCGVTANVAGGVSPVSCL